MSHPRNVTLITAAICALVNPVNPSDIRVAGERATIQPRSFHHLDKMQSDYERLQGDATWMTPESSILVELSDPELIDLHENSHCEDCPIGKQITRIGLNRQVGHEVRFEESDLAALDPEEMVGRARRVPA